MDRGRVIEFLAQIPLLQRLPSLSLRKIAQSVRVKRYENGEYVVREGKTGELIYFILEGQAEISGPADAEKGNYPTVSLKKFDTFGHDHYSNLLQPKSIWNADEASEGFSLVERTLCLEPLEVDIFRGFTLPGSPSFRQVFGGQFIGQALAAASKTVDCLKLVHSLHALFILAGHNNVPIIYHVHRIHDGKNFATRQVDAQQNGRVIFILLASFQQKVVEEFEHQEVCMPHVPDPETLPNLEELRERRLSDFNIPIREYRNKINSKKFIPWPIEIRSCDAINFSEQSEPRLKYWFKARGKLTADPALHRCVVAYASDLIFGGISLNPHRRRGLKTASLSLDHSIWFHRPVRADDWLLFVMESSSASGGRGLCNGQMFNKSGQLIMSITQEGLIRKAKVAVQNEVPKSKL
ncbi:acyl-coenzyme A thioesterase 8-like isoform X5 [Zingiber officinale]|uniref:acyl-coenzyme A thioesterase 8-like isoform X5 n=1 Tax=Zingiber officinale TaxID=94328 RepID=UPI001C4C88DD|nr:acyl-coenzyme A thioesterase 8-like isoform X5 [Zingiber officinale]